MGLRIPVGEFKNFTSGRRRVAKRGHNDSAGVVYGLYKVSFLNQFYEINFMNRLEIEHR
jgi:hypothetical protein